VREQQHATGRVITLSSARCRAGRREEEYGRGVVLRSRLVLDAYELARHAAQTDVPVLVRGETGTGKEHLAATVHRLSPRRHALLCAVNCGAIPEDNLVASVLFGHERGAFTGADRRAEGLFEQAIGGVVFLDEVAELSRSAQAALLRVLETKKIRRLGGTCDVPVDVRIVAATHCDLDGMAEEGSFRRDLLYRLNAVTLELPPLRDRLDELEPLVELFLTRAREQWGLSVRGVAEAAMDGLRAYGWPGNIRQLRNVVERGALAARSPFIERSDLPRIIRDGTEPPSRSPPPRENGGGLTERLAEYEARLLADTLRRTNGNRAEAAKVLKVPLRTFYRRIRALGLSDGDSDE
jgi:DNA-binding NtrC family response regulator